MWTSLSNQITNWITDYTANLTFNYQFSQAFEKAYDEDYELYPFDIKLPWKNVNKLKHVKLDTGDIMLVYEIWNQTDYQYTAY